MRVRWGVFGLLVFLACGPTSLADPAAERVYPRLPDPAWQRLGLNESPTAETGRGVGVVVVDDAKLHSLLLPLGDRLKHVIVDEKLNVTIVEPLRGFKPSDKENVNDSHGVPSLLQMAAAPFRVHGKDYVGIAPGATYFVVPYDGGEPKRYDRAIQWVVANRRRWNIRVILAGAWYTPVDEDPRLGDLIKNTREYPCVQSLERAVRAGILVVDGNGNSKSFNLGPPAEYLAVGTYQDYGRADPAPREETVDEPYGRNSDGHVRPDVLAPRCYVPNHKTPEGEVGYFGNPGGGTSSTSAQVAGLCALLFEQFPDADARTIKYALIRSGDPIPGSKRPGVCVNAARAIQALKDHTVRPPWPQFPPTVVVTDPNRSLESTDEVERALAVSSLAWSPEQFRPQGDEDLRQVFWHLVRDEAPTVRKAAASALRAPQSKQERVKFWEAIHQEKDIGVRGQLVLMLLVGAEADSLDDWVPLAKDPNFSARWCVIRVLRSHYPDAPRLEHAFLPEDIEKNAAPVFSWYRQRKAAR